MANQLGTNTTKIESLIETINSLPDKQKLQESKTVIPTTSVQSVKPDSGYDGLVSITVEAIPVATQATPSITVSDSGLITASATQSAGYVAAGTKSATKQLTTQAAQTITPGTSDQTIALGRYLTGTQTIKGDANLQANNIAQNVSIFGITGSYTGSGGGFPNGTEWTPSNITNIRFSSIGYGDGIWVAASVSNGIWYSTDGKTWIQSHITSNSYKLVNYADGLWVIGGNSSADKGLRYSTDGMTWNKVTDISANPYALNYCHGLWLTCSNDTTYYSADGMTWAASNLTGKTVYDYCYANGLWVCCTSSSSGLYYSTDGKTWTLSNVTSGTAYRVAYSNGIWVSGGTGIWYSTDGKTWTQSNVTVGSLKSIAHANGVWVASLSDLNATKNIYYSTDGKTWTPNSQSEFTNKYYFSDELNVNGLWVACVGAYGLYYSTDGKTWTQSNVTTGTYATIRCANGIWVACEMYNYGLCYSVVWEPS